MIKLERAGIRTSHNTHRVLNILCWPIHGGRPSTSARLPVHPQQCPKCLQACGVLPKTANVTFGAGKLTILSRILEGSRNAAQDQRAEAGPARSVCSNYKV
ncbi:hypothetical protein IF1G_05946 [Cordyceps javanica]|uniref:Uncharacterized protein n=1 Tax=Cordyceps javanica TaxID=43265 RepID=A0A545UZV9_9HYPO|nr:hypothetical protein IF1G_05946 [Cordyceps javanica]